MGVSNSPSDPPLKRALTSAAVAKAKPKSTAYKLTDGGGLYLFVTPNGGKSWRYKYRVVGKEKSLTFGSFPELGLADARKAHEAARAVVQSGADPGEQRKASAQKNMAAAASTFEKVARDLISKRLTKGDPEHRWTATYGEKVTRLLERDVFPKVGAMRITEVTAAELSPILESVAERRKVKMPHQAKVRVRPRGASTTAIHIRQLCSAIFAHAAAKGFARYDFDPTWGLKNVISKHSVQHSKHLALHELPAFWNALQAACATEAVKISVELLAITFVRTAELRSAEKSEFQLDEQVPYWLIPAQKMKKRRDHIVPLSPRAVVLLRRLFELSGQSPYLLPSRGGAGVINPNTINQLIYRMGYAGKLSAHGFRGTASTALHERGFPPHIIEMQLAHWSKRDPTAASYNHALYWPERVEMMLAWDQMLHSDHSNVVPFKKKA